MAKVWMKVEGGWDNCVDEVPRPEVVKDLDKELAYIWEVYAEQTSYECDGFHDNLPEKVADEIQELIEAGNQDEGTLFDKQAKDSQEKAFEVFKKYVTKKGSYEYIFEWDRSEGSFYGLFLMEIR